MSKCKCPGPASPFLIHEHALWGAKAPVNWTELSSERRRRQRLDMAAVGQGRRDKGKGTLDSGGWWLVDDGNQFVYLSRNQFAEFAFGAHLKYHISRVVHPKVLGRVARLAQLDGQAALQYEATALRTTGWLGAHCVAIFCLKITRRRRRRQRRRREWARQGMRLKFKLKPPTRGAAQFVCSCSSRCCCCCCAFSKLHYSVTFNGQRKRQRRRTEDDEDEEEPNETKRNSY